jgi:hypothetical protein
MDILPVFCDIDDFCQFFEPRWKRRLLSSGAHHRNRAGCLCLSEVMTIIVLFHTSNYRNFKAYYTEQVMKHYAGAFPRPRQLSALRRVDAVGARPLMRLLADQKRGLLRHLFY